MGKFTIKTTATLLFIMTLCSLSILCTSATARAAIPDVYVSIKIDDQMHFFGAEYLQTALPLETLLEQSIIRGSNGRIIGHTTPKKVPLALKNADKLFSELYLAHYIPPQNAQPLYTPQVLGDGSLDISRSFSLLSPATLGREVDINRIRTDVERTLLNGEPFSGEYHTAPLQPQITDEKLKQAFALRSSFYTDISYSTYERKHNVALALAAFDGIVLYPNDSLSFNDVTGVRDQSRGYLTAKIILDGKFQEGIGGGVCQSSSTLYNALLLGDIKIDERNHHTLTVSYVMPAFDAMVSRYTSDLKFTNSTDNVLILRTFCTADRAVVEIYGQPLEYSIVPRSEIISQTEYPPPQTVSGPEYDSLVTYTDQTLLLTPSKRGLTAECYLDYYQNGTLAFSRKMHTDIYQPMTGILARGRFER